MGALGFFCSLKQTISVRLRTSNRRSANARVLSGTACSPPERPRPLSGGKRSKNPSLIHRHASAADVRSAVDLLKGRRLVREASEAGVGAAGTGRSRIVTYAVPPGEESEISAESTQGDYLTTLISLSSQAFMASTNGATLL